MKKGNVGEVEQTEISTETKKIFAKDESLILVRLFRSQAYFVDDGAVRGDVEWAVSPHAVPELVRGELARLLESLFVSLIKNLLFNLFYMQILRNGQARDSNLCEKIIFNSKFYPLRVHLVMLQQLTQKMIRLHALIWILENRWSNWLLPGKCLTSASVIKRIISLSLVKSSIKLKPF